MATVTLASGGVPAGGVVPGIAFGTGRARTGIGSRQEKFASRYNNVLLSCFVDCVNSKTFIPIAVEKLGSCTQRKFCLTQRIRRSITQRTASCFGKAAIVRRNIGDRGQIVIIFNIRVDDDDRAIVLTMMGRRDTNIVYWNSGLPLATSASAVDWTPRGAYLRSWDNSKLSPGRPIRPAW